MTTQDFLTTTHLTIAAIKSMSDRGELDFSPPFQRNPVWLEPQKSYLIDTVLTGYPIPELYLQVIVDNEGNERHIVVDGQQRIRSVLEFIEGAYELNDDEPSRWSGMSFDDLDLDDRTRFYGYRFVVRLLPDLPDAEIRGIFKRLNRNTVALNKQELRNATYWGPFIRTMETLADDDRWVDFGIFTPNDFRRMIDIEYISELAVASIHGPQNKKDKLDDWYEAYEEEFPLRSEVMQKFRDTLGELTHVLAASVGTRWRKKSDFYTLFLLMSDRSSQLPLSAEQREGVQAELARFSEKVTQYLSISEDADRRDFEPSVSRYGNAVGRAASDLHSRAIRSEALAVALAEVWPPGD